MKTLATVAAAMVAVACFGQEVRLPSGHGGEASDATYSNAYDAGREITVTGTVTGKIKGSSHRGFSEGMTILVTNSKKHTYSVDLGPSWYVAAQVAKVNMGDKIRVIGSPIVLNGKEHILLAKNIIRGHQVLALRDERGLPYWSAQRRGRYVVSGATNSYTGQIVSENPVTVNGETEVGYQLQTDNGIVNAAIAPGWYLEQQNVGFKPGDNVTIFSGPTPAQFGNVIMAGGVYSPALTNTMLLRQYGVPMWQGWHNYNGPTP